MGGTPRLPEKEQRFMSAPKCRIATDTATILHRDNDTSVTRGPAIRKAARRDPRRSAILMEQHGTLPSGDFPLSGRRGQI